MIFEVVMFQLIRTFFLISLLFSWSACTRAIFAGKTSGADAAISPLTSDLQSSGQLASDSFLLDAQLPDANMLDANLTNSKDSSPWDISYRDTGLRDTGLRDINIRDTSVSDLGRGSDSVGACVVPLPAPTNCIPLTGLTPVFTASSSYLSNVPAKAGDGNCSSAWLPADGPNEYFVIALGVSTKVHGLTLIPATSSSSLGANIMVYVSGGTDCSNYNAPNYTMIMATPTNSPALDKTIYRIDFGMNMTIGCIRLVYPAGYAEKLGWYEVAPYSCI